MPRRSTYLSVEPTIRTFIRSPPANETDSAARIWEILRQDYDSAFTIFGRRIHLEPPRRSPGIGRNRRSELGYHRRLPPSFRAVPRSFQIIVGVLNNKPSEEQTVDVGGRRGPVEAGRRDSNSRFTADEKDTRKVTAG